jgi:predicted phage terminase large subunit-like protein
MTYSTEELKILKVAKVKCMGSLMFHTRYFFMEQFKRKFIVNTHHERIAETLELVLQGKLVKVILNTPPRYSKTEISVKNFISHALSLNAAARFIHLSFSDSLALDNADAVKDIIRTEKYKLFFPEVIIKSGTDSKKKWYTTKGGGMYSTSTAGQVTGFGAGAVDEEENEFLKELEDFNSIESKESFAGALVIDDPIKPEDAESEVKRERINARWDSTIKNRVNSRKTAIIINGQRTHPNDLCGYVMKEGYTTNLQEALANPDLWYVLSMPVINEDGTALWSFKHTIEELKAMNEASPIVFQTQYMQNPQPKEGLMYSEFKTYNVIPSTAQTIRKCYIDSADTGKDWLCSIVYDENIFGCYVVDVIYTTLPMTDTEPMIALQMTNHKVQICRIEGNNGGSNFAREVEKQCRAMKNLQTIFKTFHQSNNKQVRIFNNSAKVTNMVVMPEGWNSLFPIFYKHLTGYLKNGKNATDDAEDTITGVVEFIGLDKPTNSSGWAGAFR